MLLLPEKYRVKAGFMGSQEGEPEGAFEIPISVLMRRECKKAGIKPRKLFVIASVGVGWDHVSISAADRCPIWFEMEYLKQIFFGDQVAMQLHVQKKDYINNHEFTLHLWAPNNGQEIPLPDSILVGIK